MTTKQPKLTTNEKAEKVKDSFTYYYTVFILVCGIWMIKDLFGG